MKTPNIFISHRWAYRGDYYSLTTKFNELGWKHFDYSVPIHDSFELKRKKEIEEALREQVRQCNFFIVSARMSSLHSAWIEKEVKAASDYSKYILGVKPWDYQGNIPLFIQNTANQIVGFNTPTIINIIENYLR
ncbi:MAG: TIR domain-containing protein [Candidatus Kapabacteria bacterium]|nr:TIR domain-containing protein [Candidatus Kapabacteria bacterium]